MIDIPSSWAALISLIVTSVVGGLGFAFKDKANEVTRLSDRVKDLEDRILQMQEERMRVLTSQLDDLQRRRITDERLARSLSDQTATIEKIVQPQQPQ